MTADLTLGNQRLLQLAEILDTADERHIERGEPTYDQMMFDHHCGTPACAAGHWIAAHPERWDMSTCTLISEPFGLISDQLSKEFCVDEFEYSELFGPDGCNNAKTAKDAADYIRSFVARRSGS